MGTRSYKGSDMIILLGIIIYFLIASRCMKFGEIPSGLNPDGVVSAVDAKALAEYGTDRFGTKMPTLLINGENAQMSTMMSYLLIPCVKLLGLNSFSMRLPALIFSILGCVAIYGIVRRLLGDAVAVVALLFVAINPWHVMQSRSALGVNLFPHMFVIGVYFLLKGVEKRRYLYISMFFFALCMYCSDSAFYVVPIFLLATFLLMAAYKLILWKEVIIGALVYLGIAWPAFGTALVNFMQWETISLPFVTLQSFEGNVGVTDILFFSENIVQQLMDNLRSVINVVFFDNEDLLWPSLQDFGTIYKGTVPLIVVGWGFVIYMILEEKEIEKKVGYIVMLIYWICSMLSGIIINGVNINKMNVIFYCNIIFMVIGVWFIVGHWKASMALFVVIYGVSSVLFFYRYFTTWEEQKNIVYCGDFCEALRHAKEHDCLRYYITPDVKGEDTGEISEILTIFEFEMDAGYYLGETDEWGGEEIAYKDRFLYKNPTMYPSYSERVGYVFKAADSERFSEEFYIKTMFGDYGVAVARKIK